MQRIGDSEGTQMRQYRGRFAVRFLISVLVAAATPALAAGLVEGVSATANSVADAASPAVPDDLSAGGDMAGVQSRIATHGPARLSVLVGSGDLDWASK